MTPVACRNTMLIAGSGALALAVVAPLLHPADLRARASIRRCRRCGCCLPGTIALSGSKVITSYIFSQGRPLVNTTITAVSLVVTVVADFTLVPLYGVNGAARSVVAGLQRAFRRGAVCVRQDSGQPAVRSRRAESRGPAAVCRWRAQRAAPSQFAQAGRSGRAHAPAATRMIEPVAPERAAAHRRPRRLRRRAHARLAAVVRRARARCPRDQLLPASRAGRRRDDARAAPARANAARSTQRDGGAAVSRRLPRRPRAAGARRAISARRPGARRARDRARRASRALSSSSTASTAASRRSIRTS